MTLESQVATYLRASTPLMAILIGGVYEDSVLGVEGVTSATTTPNAWTGGTFRPSAIVRQRARVPQYRVYDEAEQLVDTAQVVEIYLFALSVATIESAADRIYALMQGHHFTNSFAATWEPGLPLMDVPNLPNVQQLREDYRVPALRKPA